MATTDFHNHLIKQLNFLDRSCKAYDAGYYDEGIRIATVIRILIHQTKNSTSLLKHLNLTTISLLSTVNFIHDKVIHAPMHMSTITISNDGANYQPNLGNSGTNIQMPVSKWWDQIVVVGSGIRLSRRKIVLSATNKDGGAHVDTALDYEYEQIASDGFAGYITGNKSGNHFEGNLTGTNTVCLRQMGYEILNSIELIKQLHKN